MLKCHIDCLSSQIQSKYVLAVNRHTLENIKTNENQKNYEFFCMSISLKIRLNTNLNS